MTDTLVRHRRPPDRRDRILDIAEHLAPRRGYHGFSFRDVAAGVGVKSASVHHHFPTKSDLTAALADRYRTRFLGMLGEPSGPEALRLLVAGYRAALVEADAMCLCGFFWGGDRCAARCPVGEGRPVLW
ncbi:MAG: helix-turn-helix domain-containing protein [Pseudomonadota bacterium]